MKVILHVEDDEVNRKIVRDLLRAKNYQVVEAEDGEAGVRLATEVRPDLILMDIQLPGLNGYDATRRIRETIGLENIPIVVITSYALSGDEDKALAAGCTDYIAKPYDPIKLLEKIQKWIA